MKKAASGTCQLERPGAVVHRLVADPGLGAPRGVRGHPAAGVIGRRAAVVVFGESAHAVVAEHHVVGGEDRAVVERRRDNRRPDRHAVDPLRRGERWDRIGIAGILLHGCVEGGAVGVIVREAAVPLLIQAPAVVGARGDDRGVQIDLVERPGHGKLGALGHATRDGRRSRAGGLPGRVGGLLGRGDGGGGGLGGGFGGLLGGGGGRAGGGGRFPGGGGSRCGCLGGVVDGGLGGRRGGGAGLDGGGRVPGGLGGGLGRLGGRIGDGRGGGIAGRGRGVGSLGGRRGTGFGGGGRVGGVLRLRCFGGQGGGRGCGGGGLTRGVCRLGGGLGRGLGFGGARIPGGDGRCRGFFRGRGGPFRRRGPGVGLVILPAADEREPGGPNARFGAGSQHGAARDLSLSQAGPILPAAHCNALSGSRLPLCGIARCKSPASIAHYRGTPPPTHVMSGKKEIDGFSTEFFGFGRCWNPPCVTREVPACDRAPEPHPSGPPSPSLQMERGLGGEVPQPSRHVAMHPLYCDGDTRNAVAPGRSARDQPPLNPCTAMHTRAHSCAQVNPSDHP